jgi:DNA-binding NtrC family response regulator
MKTIDTPLFRTIPQILCSQFEHGGQNMIKSAADESTGKEYSQMNKNTDLILTGWGYAEYVASAAVALRALDGRADVYGVSRRRLPEFLLEMAAERGALKWKRIYLLGISLSGDPDALKTALGKLKSKGVKVTWISALEMPEHIADMLDGILDARCFEGSLLEAVGNVFEQDVDAFMPFLNDRKKVNVDIRAYLELIDTAQFYYRNYQDESLYAATARYLASGVRPAAWDAEIKKAVEHYDRYGGRELIGKSLEMTRLQERINKVAKHEHARVLILGESGTGKETVAQQIHTKSPRRGMPFVAFNCASVTKELLEDRFFGHEKGAFTTAIERTDGLFLQADGGTLFLDEIGEMSLDVQAILLRVLEGGRFMRVGGKEELKCDVRLITATNRNLPKLVCEGKFREDLYQRLNVVQMRTPSLREHKDDIALIANSWWRKFHSNAVLSEKQIAALMDYDYPGNVRELINILDRATALEEDDFDVLMREHKEMNAGLSGGLEAKSGRIPDKLDDAIKLHIRRVYEKYGQNLSSAAKALDVSRNTVRKHL